MPHPRPVLRRLTLSVGLLTALTLWESRGPRATFAADGRDARWDGAVEQSQDAGRPAVVLFTADWCPVCQSFRRETLARPDVAGDLRDRHTFVVIDLTDPTPADAERARRFGVTGLPTLVRFDRRGRESARANAMPAANLLRWLAADASTPTE